MTSALRGRWVVSNVYRLREWDKGEGGPKIPNFVWTSYLNGSLGDDFLGLSCRIIYNTQENAHTQDNPTRDPFEH